MKRINFAQRVFLTIFFLFFNGYLSVAQTLSAPTFSFTNVCTTSTTNFYDAQFTFNPASFNVGNQFILELSDANGLFTVPVALQTISATSSPGLFNNFAFPITTNGFNYKLRVRSTSPSLISSNSVAFEAHYKIFDRNFTINNRSNDLAICGSSSATLSIDENTVAFPSPKPITSLTYRWYRNGTVISGQFGTSIVVSTAGTYQCFIDYGICSTFDFGQDEKSNIVNVTVMAPGQTFTLVSSLGNTVCSSVPTTLSTTAGFTYQWFRDGNLIAGANSNTYVTGVPGTYHVTVGTGACATNTNAITLNAQTFNASIDALLLPTVNIISEGETRIVSVTTDASSPTYQWYDSNGPIIGATTASQTFALPGVYKVIINQTSGCITSKELNFELKVGIKATKVPNIISLNGAEENRLWRIPQEYINQQTEIKIIEPTGKIAFQTLNYQNNWPDKAIEFDVTNPVYYYIISKDGSPVKKGSITIIK